MTTMSKTLRALALVVAATTVLAAAAAADEIRVMTSGGFFSSPAAVRAIAKSDLEPVISR
jgi:hypothetical protein